VSASFLVLGAAALVAGLVLGGRVDVRLPDPAAVWPAPAGTAGPGAGVGPTAPAEPALVLGPTASPASAQPPLSRSFSGLQTRVDALLQSAGAEGGVSLIELGGGQSWSLNGDEPFGAASTYKLPLLMKEAQAVVAGSARKSDMLCYEPDDWEDGWFTDYESGACFTRAELHRRVGTYSDNTAAHILVRANGGGDALNAYARAHGATESEFWDPNVTTSADLARLWRNEATGRAGGAAAQRYLYPLLTDTEFEDGIPAGTPGEGRVAHKVGILDGVLNDAGLVVNGPRGAYVLTICTEGGSWSLVAAVARAVAQFEAA